MEELIRIRDLTTSDINKAALQGFRLQVFSGETFGLIGLNGSGKSTLADVLAGEVEVDRGEIFLNGNRIQLSGQRLSRHYLEKQGVFVIKNENRLIGNLNVVENMSISVKPRILDLLKNPAKRGRLLELTLNEFMPQINPHVYASGLSAAVHWEIGILKAYIEGARLIVLDRIIEFCSDNERYAMFNLIHSLKMKGTGFVISFNKTGPFLRDLDRIGIVRNGELSGILHRSDYDAGIVESLIIGREFSDRFLIKKESASVGSNLLEIRESSPGDGTEDILSLHSGEILGIYDPVQDRSEELIRVLSGSGFGRNHKVFIEGTAVDINEDFHAVRAGIGVVSENIFDRLFYRELTAGENLVIAAARRSSGVLGHIPSAADRYIKNTYLSQTGIPLSSADSPVKYIEKDYQFILAIHMRILSGVKIFILENPVRRADLLTYKMIYQRMESLSKAGSGVIFISTDYTELEGFCDRIIHYNSLESQDI